MASSFSFIDAMESLEKIGFYEVALPFILIFTIVFAILQKVKIFGEKGKNFNAVIAVVLAFLVIRNQAIVEVLNQFLPKISLISVIIVVTLILFAILLNKEDAAFGGWLGGIGMIVLVIGLIIAFIGSGGGAVFGFQLPDWFDITMADRNLLIFVVLFIIFFAYVTSDGSSDKTSPLAWLEELPNKITGGKK
ncbi:hypothetical protein J4467_03520 [Candidatus Woesearchaeota archaeon]|nr:hypothetical protein [Candidatus Woesearchaeota archaeon]